MPRKFYHTILFGILLIYRIYLQNYKKNYNIPKSDTKKILKYLKIIFYDIIKIAAIWKNLYFVIYDYNPKNTNDLI